MLKSRILSHFIKPIFRNKKTFLKTKTQNLFTLEQGSKIPNLMFFKLGLNFTQKKTFIFKPHDKDSNLSRVHSEELKDFKDEIEKSIKHGEALTNEILSKFKTLSEEDLFKLIGDLNRLPISKPDILRKFFQENLDKIPTNNLTSISELFLLLDKIHYENINQFGNKISEKVKDFIKEEADSIDKEALTTLIYLFSKQQVIDKTIWQQFYTTIKENVNKYDIGQISRLFLSFTMVQTASPDILKEQEFHKLYEDFLEIIEKKLSQLTYLDTFRICIAFSKKPVELLTVSKKIFDGLQQNFKDNINEYDLYQISQILLLLCETPYLDSSIFPKIEDDLLSNYIDLPENEFKKLQEIDLTGFLEDLSKVGFSFNLARAGSINFWKKFLQVFERFNQSISNLALENMLFVCYRLIDLLAQLSQQSGINTQNYEETNKKLQTVFKNLENKIAKEKLLQDKKIDSYNAMMPFARFGNINPEIWDPLSKNILELITSNEVKSSKINPYMLTDLIFAFSNYYMNLIIQRDMELMKFSGSGKDKMEQFNKLTQETLEKNFFLKNFEKFWSQIESFLLRTDPKNLEIAHLGNMTIDLSQIDIEMEKTWNYLIDHVREKLKLPSFDTNNFIMIVMGFSKKGIENQQLWKDLIEFAKNNIDNFSLDEIRKIVLSFLRNKESAQLWKAIEERISKKETLEQLNFEFFQDMQIPFAITGISSDKIWNKFEEFIFKNLQAVNDDKEILMNSIYSFSRVGKGSSLLWNKFATIISQNVNSYDIDDLGHLVVCLKSSYLNKLKVDNVLNESFWKNFAKNIEDKLPNAGLNSCNNLLKGVKENDYLNKNDKLIKNIDERTQILLKELK
jgi:hypothetical protein